MFQKIKTKIYWKKLLKIKGWLLLLLLFFVACILYFIDNRISYFLFFVALSTNAGVWLWDDFRERKFNQDLKELLVEELDHNLIIVNDNIWQVKHSGDLEKGLHFEVRILQDRIFNSLVNSNKMVMLNEKVRQPLFKIYTGADNISSASNPNSIIVKKVKDGDVDYYVKLLEEIKYKLKNVLQGLEKGQLYEKHKLEGFGKEHELKEEFYFIRPDELSKEDNQQNTA